MRKLRKENIEESRRGALEIKKVREMEAQLEEALGEALIGQGEAEGDTE